MKIRNLQSHSGEFVAKIEKLPMKEFHECRVERNQLTTSTVLTLVPLILPVINYHILYSNSNRKVGTGWY